MSIDSTRPVDFHGERFRASFTSSGVELPDIGVALPVDVNVYFVSAEYGPLIGTFPERWSEWIFSAVSVAYIMNLAGTFAPATLPLLLPLVFIFVLPPLLPPSVPGIFRLNAV